MELQYQFKPEHFPVVYRLVRSILDRASAVSLAYLLLSLFPSILLLAWQDNLGYALPFVLVAIAAVIGGRWHSKRHMRSQFRTLCVSRTLRLSDQMLEIEWRHGWSRHAWSEFSSVENDRGWLVLRRRDSAAVGAAMPPEMVVEASQRWRVDLEAELRGWLQKSEASQLSFREESTALKAFQFRMTKDEMAQLAERSFQRRDAVDNSQGVFSFALLVVVFLLLAAPLPKELAPFARRVLAPAIAVPMTLAALAPFKRKVFGWLIGDQWLLREQEVLIREAGVEQRRPGEQTFARWSQVSTTIDAKRFIVILTHHGGIVCLPRRIFAAGEDDETLALTSSLMQQARPSDFSEPHEGVSAESPFVESGNPYQPPQQSDAHE